MRKRCLKRDETRDSQPDNAGGTPNRVVAGTKRLRHTGGATSKRTNSGKPGNQDMGRPPPGNPENCMAYEISSAGRRSAIAIIRPSASASIFSYISLPLTRRRPPGPLEEPLEPPRILSPVPSQHTGDREVSARFRGSGAWRPTAPSGPGRPRGNDRSVPARNGPLSRWPRRIPGGSSRCGTSSSRLMRGRSA